MSDIFESVGIDFAQTLGPLLEWITRDGVGPGLAAVIIVAGLFFLAVIMINGFKDLSHINSALKILEKEGGPQKTFSKNYNKIDQDFLKINKIEHAWSEFTETIIQPTRDEEGAIHACSNTERPHDFFNLHDLDMGPSFTKILPSIFIAVGLSLTFLGLIAALSSAVQGMEAAAGDTQSIQGSISGLLNAASAKFYASLSALFMSIILTLGIKSVSWILEVKLKHLNQKIETGMQHLSLESLAQKSNMIMTDQLDQLKTFNTDLAMKIGDQVQNSLEKTLGPLLNKLADMGSEINESNIKNLQKITEEMIASIKGATGESMERVANTLDAVGDKLSGLTDILSGSLASFDSDFKKILSDLTSTLEEGTGSLGKGLNEATKKMLEDMEKASESAGESMGKAGEELAEKFKTSTTDLVNSFTTMNSQVIALETSLNSMSENLVTINAELAKSSESIKDSSDQFSVAGDGLQSSIEPLTNFVTETRGVMMGLTESLDASFKGAALASESIKESVDVIRREVTQQVKELSGSDEQLANLLGQIEDSTSRVLQTVSDYVTEVDTTFAGSLGQLRGTIVELQDSIDQLTEAKNDRKD